MPRWDSSAPRKKLPPPTTTPTCVPPRTTSAICRAREWTTSGPTPTPPPPNSSPESLSMTRRYQVSGGAKPPVLLAGPLSSRRAGSTLAATRSAGPDLEVGEPGEGDPGRVEHLLDRALGLTHRLLLEQDVVGVEGVEPALDDLGDRLLGLALGAGLLLQHSTLGRDHVGRDVLTGEVART